MSDQPEIQPIDATAGLLNLPDVQAVEFVLTVTGVVLVTELPAPAPPGHAWKLGSAEAPLDK